MTETKYKCAVKINQEHSQLATGVYPARMAQRVSHCIPPREIITNCHLEN